MHDFSDISYWLTKYNACMPDVYQVRYQTKDDCVRIVYAGINCAITDYLPLDVAYNVAKAMFYALSDHILAETGDYLRYC